MTQQPPLPIPDKFEDLSPIQVEYFARLGFEMFCSVTDSIRHSSDLNARCQHLSSQQQKFMQEINSTVMKVK